MRLPVSCAPTRPRVLKLAAQLAFALLIPGYALAQVGQTADTATGASPLAKYDATSIDNVNS